MATTTTKPNFNVTLPNISANGRVLLDAITADTIWNETSLQYFIGDDHALELDSQFSSAYFLMFDQTPHASYYFNALTHRAFQIIDTVSRLDFGQTVDASIADHVLVSTSEPSKALEGFFQFPGSSFHDANPSTDSWALGAINSGLAETQAPPALAGDGEYANWTLLHEIGHSLGLMHTHQDIPGQPALPSVGEFMNNERYSVMSYKGATSANGYGHAVSFMALDVAALQALYGAEAYAAGQSTYMLFKEGFTNLQMSENSVWIGRAYYCIWDSGGRDTIGLASINDPVLINLNAATLDRQSMASDIKGMIASLHGTDLYKGLSAQLQEEIVNPKYHAGGFFSRVLEKSGKEFIGEDGGFSIANGVMIENATGGANADLLIGNWGANTLNGNSGDDDLVGSAGRDKLLGDTGNDLLDGGRGSDDLDGGAGNDIFVFSDGYGFDEVLKFEKAGDVIDLRLLSAVKDFKDLLKDHASNSGGGVEIVAGHDTLLLHGVSESGLRDFMFMI